MMDLIRRIEFRPFSYEEDPEAVVDMQRCRELLHGEWLDEADTCRMHHKVVTRTPGSSWVIAFRGMVFGYADLVPGPDATGFVTTWRFHPDYRQPKVVRKLLTGLLEAGKARNYDGLVFFADNEEVLADLESVGLKRDRAYVWVQPGEAEAGPGATSTPFQASLDDLERETLLPFLGPPLPARYVLTRSYLAASYGISNYHPPALYRLRLGGLEYTACFDGREWFVFRGGRRPEDKDAIPMLLSALGEILPRKILLSQKAAQTANLAPASNTTLWDLFSPGLG